ncbi:winged helix-turn-helix domain-containing protein [Salarchaeum sp. III]|uniref:helix-turn-helix transcriptional regulator n=1 Tax=Salarchaeum sp. III TaxID=3107927 RepID=UPI002ED9213F
MPESDAEMRRLLERRSPVLATLQTAPARKPELVAELESSRSTVDRAITELTEAGLVEKDGSEYTMTTAGRLALREYREYERATDAVSLTTAFVNHLPRDAPVSTSLLEGASVTMGADHAPDQALKPSNELFQRATRMRGLAPVVLSFYPSLLAERLGEGDLTVEIVAEPDVLEALPSLPEFGTEPLSEVDGLELYESDQELPYALWIMDTPESSYAGITAYDGGGVVGVLINEVEEAVQWAEDQYAQYREGADEISTAEL